MLVEGHSYLKFLNENWSKWKYFLPRYYPPPVLEDIPIVVTDILNAMPSQIYTEKTISEKAVDSALTIVENITSPEKMISRALQGVFGADIYENIVNISVIPSLFPKISELCNKSITGVYNFVNKGIITQPILMEKYVSKNFVVGVYSPGYELSTDKLEKYLEVPLLDDALISLTNIRVI